MNKNGLRKSLILGTSLIAASLYGGWYGRKANAACVLVGGTYFCEGASAGIAITADDATVETLPVPPNNPLVINEPTDDGLNITGDGAISFTDNYNASITSDALDALEIRSTGDNGAVPGSVTILSNGTFMGDALGIYARNDGTAGVDIQLSGDVTGTNFEGIFAYNSGNGTSLSVTTGPGAITGDDNGITAVNFGSAAVVIQVSGDVTGTGRSGAGISARNSINGTSLSVTTGPGAVTGGDVGISASNQGIAGVDIQVTGDVTGGSRGITVGNSANGTSLSIMTGPGAVTGDASGIAAGNFGSAGVDIQVSGDVTAGNSGGSNSHGIDAYNSANGTSLSVTTGPGAVTGSNGIRAVNRGTASVDIQVSGEVTGISRGCCRNTYGIYAYNSGNSTSLTIATGPSAVTGGFDGINAHNSGTGPTTLTLGGDVTGGAGAGVRLTSATITTLTSLGRLSALSDRAIRGSDVIDAVANFGDVIGFVELAASGDTFANEAGGIFSARGDSDFGAGADEFDNKAGAAFRLLDSGGPDAVTLTNLEVFRNIGRITLQDADVGGPPAEGDVLTLPGDFQGGGTLAVDAALGGPGSTSDMLIINGNVSGTTGIEVNDTGPAGGALNMAGIPVVYVSAGTTDADDFTLVGGPIDKGFFVYDLELQPTGTWVLASEPAKAALETPVVLSAVQNIWHATTYTWLERTADLRGLIMPAGGGTGGPTVSSAQSGMWGRFIGQIADRDADNGIKYDEALAGFQVGFDGGLQGVFNPSDTVLFGILGGYINADIDFDGSATNVDIDSYQVGASVTWLNGGFFTDLLVKAEILDLDYAVPAAAASNSLNGYSLGFSLDAGYRMWLNQTVFLEPIGAVSFVHTSIDDATLAGFGINYKDGESLRGRAGARLGTTWTAEGTRIEPYLEAFLNGELAGKNTALVNGVPFADRNDGVYGTAGIGAQFLGPDGVSGFIDLDAIFGGDVIGGSAKVGIRFNL